MRSGNPVLNARTFENFGLQQRDLAAEDAPVTTMTVTGTANRTMFLLALAFCSACFTWSRTFDDGASPSPVPAGFDARAAQARLTAGSAYCEGELEDGIDAAALESRLRDLGYLA